MKNQPGHQADLAMSISKAEEREVWGVPSHPLLPGDAQRGRQLDVAVPGSCISVLVVEGGLSVVVAATVVVVVAAVVVAAVGATVGTTGIVVASMVAAVAVASVLLKAPVAPKVVGAKVGGAER